MFEAGLKPWQTAAWKPTGISLHGRRGVEKEKTPSEPAQDKEADSHQSQEAEGKPISA